MNTTKMTKEEMEQIMSNFAKRKLQETMFNIMYDSLIEEYILEDTATLSFYDYLYDDCHMTDNEVVNICCNLYFSVFTYDDFIYLKKTVIESVLDNIDCLDVTEEEIERRVKLLFGNTKNSYKN